MYRTGHPCRQLNSGAIKSAALCYISPIVVGKCSIVSAKCICKVTEEGLQGAWNDVVKRREACDEAIYAIKNVAFFFSAISAQGQQKNRGKKRANEEESDESNDESITSSQVASTTSQEWLSNHPTVIDKKLRPSLNYWIALTTPNGAPANPIIIHRVLLDCGVETIANQVPCYERKESAAMKELYKVLKDHKNPMIQELVNSSYEHCSRDEVESLFGDADLLEDEDCGTENAARVCLTNPSFCEVLHGAVTKLKDAKLVIDQFGFDVHNPNNAPGKEEPRLSDKLTVLINDIAIAMKRAEYALFRGKIFKKVSKAKFTYSYKCEVRAFVNCLAANEFFKARLLKDMRKVIDILADPDCEVIRPISVDYNLIEVNSGECWSLKERCFVGNPIPEEKVGLVTPRAFAMYDPRKEPDGKFFREILQNSLTHAEIGAFCEDFLNLLNFNNKRHKDRVPCLVGDANSGKTSLFHPILGLIHHDSIATITKQRVFNKAMITKSTEVIFIDEASPSTMDIDDWKILTQGGYTACDVKYQTAKSFINRCPMLITAQQKLQFKPEDQPAMDRRLRNYMFKSLSSPKKRATEWLRKNPMECVVWAAANARRAEDEEDTSDTSDEDEHEDQEMENRDGILAESEKEVLRTMPLLEAISDSDEDDVMEARDNSSDEDRDGRDDAALSITNLRKMIDEYPPMSLRHRQATRILESRMEENARLQDWNKRAYERRQRHFMSRGVTREHVALLPEHVDDPLPTQIENDLAAREEEQRKDELEESKRRAKKVFELPWLQNTEKEMKECMVARRSNSDQETAAWMEARRELLQDKLENHHKNLGTLRCKEALAERKRVCIMLGLLRKEDEHLVNSLTEPLPLRYVANALGEDEEEQHQERDMFVTPKTPSYAPQDDMDDYYPPSPPTMLWNVAEIPLPRGNSSGEKQTACKDPQSRKKPTHRAQSQVGKKTCTSRKRPTHRAQSQESHKRPRNNLLNYFSASQK